jgi:pimeloyl-ACP methyl ester carboxylesterase
MAVKQTVVQTSHGETAVSLSTGRGFPVLLIHGNSSCKGVFNGLLESELGHKYRLIAFDLPGHGASSDAVEPEKTYSVPGYADLTIAVLDALRVDKVAIYGWSLGGYIALEVAARFPRLAGLMISGAPPVHPTAQSLQGAYRQNPQVHLFGKAEFTKADSETFTKTTYGTAANAALRAAARRTDGRARAMTIAGLLAGNFADGLQTIEAASVPVALVDGADDPFIDSDYVEGLKFANLWEEYHQLPDVGHAPFLQAPDVFRPILGRFLAEVDRRATTPPADPVTAVAA